MKDFLFVFKNIDNFKFTIDIYTYIEYTLNVIWKYKVDITILYIYKRIYV